MKDYRVFVFDLFDTLIDFNRSRLPAFSIDGEKHNSTFTEVYKVFEEYYHGFDKGKFHDSFVESYEKFQQLKSIENKEFYNGERFRILMSSLGIELSSDVDPVVDEMVKAHMKSLSSTMEFPEENRDVLDLMFDKNDRMAIISNFDYAPAAYMLLSKFDIRKYFESVVISVEVGWRKPRPEIFLKALELLNLDPRDALYVGDNYYADVVGAKSVGIDVVWINRKDEKVYDQKYRPNHTVSKLTELINLISWGYV
ncbi:MAG: HAD family hydrolase [Thermodesulfobacteriota bacterium]